MPTSPEVARTLLLCVALGLSPAAQAQAPPPDPLTPGRVGQMTLRELMEQEVVHAAARYDQKPSEAASAITLITAEEIRQFGYRTMQDVLSAVPGFYTTFDRNYSYLGIRGISPPGDYNARVLVLLDGHRLNENTYDGVYIGTDSMIDMNLVDRVEIVHGPGASLYGSNAVFAVVNFVTQRATGGRHLQVEGDAGSLGTQAGRVQFSTRTASGLDLLVAGSRYASDGHRSLYFEEFASSPTRGVTTGTDGDAYQRLFARASRGTWTFESAWARRDKHVPTASYSTVFNDPRTMTMDQRGFASLGYRSPATARWAVSARVAIDHYAYNGDYATDYSETATPDIVVNHDQARGTWFTSETQLVRTLRGHRLLGGLELRVNRQGIQNFDRVVYTDLNARTSVVGLFAQDEWKLHRRLALVLGVRHDRYASFGGTTNPRLAAVMTMTPHTTVKLTYGRAFRPPNLAERTDEIVDPGGPFGTPVRPETMITAEAVLEHRLDHVLGGDASISLSGYENRLRDLIGTYNVDGWTHAQNFGEAHSHGLELDGRVRWPHGIVARGSLSVNRADDGHGEPLPNAPREVGVVRLRLPIVGDRLGLAVQQMFVAARLSADGTRVPPAITTDATLQWLGTRRLSVTANVRNVFNRAVFNPTSSGLVQSRLQLDGRTLYVNTAWRF